MVCSVVMLFTSLTGAVLAAAESNIFVSHELFHVLLFLCSLSVSSGGSVLTELK